MKCAGLILLLPILMHAQPGLRAGLARVNITPPNGQAMGGWPERTHGAARTHDPLYATVLLLEAGSVSVALVACDLESFVSARVAGEARQKFGVEYTILSMSGTHSGPATADARGRWHAGAEDKIVAAIGEARQSLFPAELRVASGRAYLGFNRRKVTEGRARMWWRNPEGLPSHPLDPTVGILAVRDTEKLRAVLVNYAARATVLGPANLEFSADFPGALRRYVETQAAGALCLFVQGASGDISPNREARTRPRPGIHRGRRHGQRAGRRGHAPVPHRQAAVRCGAAAAPHLRADRDSHRWQPQERIAVGFTAGIIGGDLCSLALPGEPFIEHQIAFRARSECRMPMVFGASYQRRRVGGRHPHVGPRRRAARAPRTAPAWPWARARC